MKALAIFALCCVACGQMIAPQEGGPDVDVPDVVLGCKMQTCTGYITCPFGTACPVGDGCNTCGCNRADSGFFNADEAEGGYHLTCTGHACDCQHPADGGP